MVWMHAYMPMAVRVPLKVSACVPAPPPIAGL